MKSTCGAAQFGIGAVTGFAVGTLVLGMAIMAFILLGIPRSVVVIYKPDIPKESFHKRFPKSNGYYNATYGGHIVDNLEIYVHSMLCYKLLI